MTKEEAIKELRDASDSEVRYGDTEYHYDKVMKRVEAFDMAIKALEQQPNRCDSCIHSEEQDGSNCYECVKGITDNFELMCDATEEERKSVKDYVESISKPTGVHFDETQPTDADCISKQDVDALVDELARAISDERCCISRGRSTATIMQDILDLPSVTPQPRWIPCSERLPHDGQNVLVYGDMIKIDTCMFYHASAYWEHYVIAWMPLPEPYKAESEGDENGVCSL